MSETEPLDIGFYRVGDDRYHVLFGQSIGFGGLNTLCNLYYTAEGLLNVMSFAANDKCVLVLGKLSESERADMSSHQTVELHHLAVEGRIPPQATILNEREKNFLGAVIWKQMEKLAQGKLPIEKDADFSPDQP